MVLVLLLLRRVINEKETMDLLTDVAGNINADQVVKGPYLDRAALKGLTFKDLIRTNKTKFIDWNKAAMALALGTPEEVKVSEYIKGAARNRELDQSQIFEVDDKGNVQTDKQGNAKFAPTSLGRMIEGLVTGKSYKQEDVTSKVVTDDFALWSAKDRAKRKRDIEDMAVLTQPFNQNRGMFANDVEITKDGNFRLKGSNYDKEKEYRSTHYCI